jgi:hypothetical protein
MSLSRSSFLAAFLCATFFVAGVPSAHAQGTGEQKGQDQGQKQPSPSPGETAKEEKRKVDEFAEAARLLNGPAGHPECVWFGRRVLHLLWRDDLDPAFRQLELYDRFGCPGDHLQQTFRCMIRQGDPKPPESLSVRVHACWINPSQPPMVASPATGTPPGTSNQETR